MAPAAGETQLPGQASLGRNAEDEFFACSEGLHFPRGQLRLGRAGGLDQPAGNGRATSRRVARVVGNYAALKYPEGGDPHKPRLGLGGPQCRVDSITLQPEC